MATSSAQMPSEFNNPNLSVLLSEDAIQARIKELGAQITREVRDRFLERFEAVFQVTGVERVGGTGWYGFAPQRS